MGDPEILLSEMSTTHTSQLLSAKLAGVRGKQLGLALGGGLAWIALAAVALLGTGMLLDWKWNLPLWARLLFLLFDALVLMALIVRHVLLPMLNQPDDEEVALRVEKSSEFSGFRTRLIAATQFGQAELPPGIAGSMVQALIGQTEEMSRAKDFKSIVPTERFWQAAIIALLVVGLGALAYNRYPDVARDLLQRAFLFPGVEVPRNTHMESITAFRDDNSTQPDTVFARQDSIRIEVAVKGFSKVSRPATATVAIQYASAENAVEHTVTNSAAAGFPGRYVLRLKNAGTRESFTVTAWAGDAFEISSKIVIESRPSVADIEFVQEFPAYTGLTPQPRRRGDLTLLAGSKLKVKITPNKPVTSGVAYLFRDHKIVTGPDGQPKVIDATVGADGTVSLTLPLRELDITGFSIKLIDQNNFDSKNEALYRIAMLPDKPPVLRVLQPVRKEEKVTARAYLPLMVQVSDDYAVDQIVLMYTHGNAPPQMIKLEPVEAGKPFGRKARIPYRLLLSTLKPPVGTEIEYWFEATDRCAPTAGRGESRHLIALVVSDEEKRRDLQNRATDSITGVNETASTQEKLNQQLGEIIRVQAVPGPPKNE